LGAERGDFDAKIEPKMYQKQPKWNPKGDKMSQGTFKDLPCGTGSKKQRKRERPLARSGSHFGEKYIKNTIEHSLKNQSRKNMKIYAKCDQIDPK
jgi:hypothetical protein